MTIGRNGMLKKFAYAAIAMMIFTGCALSSASTNGSSGKHDLANGKKIFDTYCTGCHTTGVSLENFSKTVSFIKHPSYPMPKFYPKPLSEKDVEDVAAYIQSK